MLRWLLALRAVPVVLASLAVPFAAVGRVRRSPRAEALALWCLALWVVASPGIKPAVLYATARVRPSLSAWATDWAVGIAGLGLLYGGRRWMAATAWTLTAWGSLLVWADLLHYRFFADFVASFELGAAGQLPELWEAIVELTRPRDVFLLADLPLALVALLLAGRGIAPGGRRRPVAALGAVAAAGLLILPSVLSPLPEPGGGRPWALHSAAGRGIYAHHLRDLIDSLLRGEPRPTEADVERALRWLEGARERRSGSGPWAGAAAGRNLVMIQVESMQSFVVDFEVGERPVMPNLRRRAAEPGSLLFPGLVDQTASGRSSAGDFVIQTSLLPVEEGIAFRHARDRFHALAHVLTDAGWRSISAVPHRPSFWNRRLTHAAYGYGTRLFRDDFEPGLRIGWGLNDREFLAQMGDRLAATEEPFVAWLSTLSLHYPYKHFPQQEKRLRLGRFEGPGLGNYLHSMHLFDDALEELLERFEAAGLAERTVFAVFGDHDSGLFRDRRLAREVFGAADDLTLEMHDRVPLIVLVPGLERAAEIRTPAGGGQVDIAPTLLALLGHDARHEAFVGRNLLAEDPDGLAAHPSGTWIGTAYARLRDRAGRTSCWALARHRRVPPAVCAAGDAEARAELEVSTAILAGDLQDRLRELLAADPGDDREP